MTRNGQTHDGDTTRGRASLGDLARLSAHGDAVPTRRLEEIVVERVDARRGSLTLHAPLDDTALSAAVLIVSAGGLRISSPDDTDAVYPVHAGQAAYVVGWRNYTIATDDDTVFLVVRFPETVIRSVGVRIDDTGFRISAPGMTAPVTAFLESLLTEAEVPPLAAYMLHQLVHEMVGSLFLETFGVDHAESGSDAALYQQAAALILARRSDPSVDSAALAGTLGVSVRRLQTVFRGHGMTVARQLRVDRTNLAIDMLTDSTYSPLSIADIAEYAGFPSPAALRSALSELGLARPAQIRRAAATAIRSGPDR